MKRNILLSVAALLCSVSIFAEGSNEAKLLRFPSVSNEKIIFSYAGDLYSVSVDGGVATRLTSDIGYEVFSRISPDGRTIAFTGQYDGNTEVYTMPIDGGAPVRITYSATVDRDDIGDRMGPDNIVMCWTPDGKEIVYRSKWYSFAGLRGLLFKVSADGSQSEQIPTTEGGFCSYSPDGKYLALNRMFREFRTWKYYRGGQADDIWINKVGTTELENITNNDAQDIFPMWIGDKIFFMSDRDQIMNLFCYDTNTKQIRKVTDFTEYDCKFPSFCDNYIVFENGGEIFRYSVNSDKCDKVRIVLNDEAIYSRDKLISYKEGSSRIRGGYSLSPDGTQVLCSYRGDIFMLPAISGNVLNITATSGAHDRNPQWSPDGKKIAYFSDKDGEYQLYVADKDNPFEAKAMTKFKNGYPDGIIWSPDSERIYFQDQKNRLYCLNLNTKKCEVIITGKYGGIRGVDISSDGRWIAYSTTSETGMSAVYIYDTISKGTEVVTTLWYDSSSPMFSEDGKYLFYTSSRDFRANYSRVEWNASYQVNSYLFVLPLNNDVPNPCLISPQKPLKKEKVGAISENGDASVKIDFENIVQRAEALPLGSGYFRLVACYDGALYYYERGELKKLSLDNLKVSNVTKSSVVDITPDYKKALISDKGKLYVTSVPSFKGDKALTLEDISVVVDFHEEWNQIYNETWRIYRDYFYAENMVGRDWDAIREKYAVLLPYVNHRQDLTYLIGEMIGELNTGHCYVNTGEAPKAKKIDTGLLGAKFSKDNSGYFRIDKIFEGVSWGNAQRSPLAQPGLDVEAGDYIIAINGRSTKELNSIYQPLVGKVGVTVALMVNNKPSEDGARTIYVKPIKEESSLAYYDWVQENIRKVDEASNGEIGYIHIPDMSVAGLDEFTKLFYSQLGKKALIIDDRMNGGGNVSPMILERLQREAYRMNMYRNGGEQLVTVPNESHNGPKVCLIDKYSSSDGDLFPYGFRQLGLGKIIGVRSWGGIVGISGSKPYLDGQDVRTPFFTSYSTDGEWIIENVGVIPDIIVDLNPFDDYLGEDAQLNNAIEVLKEELKNYKPLPGVPSDPVR